MKLYRRKYTDSDGREFNAGDIRVKGVALPQIVWVRSHLSTGLWSFKEPFVEFTKGEYKVGDEWRLLPDPKPPGFRRVVGAENLVIIEYRPSGLNTRHKFKLCTTRGDTPDPMLHNDGYPFV